MLYKYWNVVGFELCKIWKEQFQNSLSDTSYTQIECSFFRYKTLKVQFYTKQMGEGGLLYSYTPKDEWEYPKPNTSKEFMLNKICEEHWDLNKS